MRKATRSYRTYAYLVKLQPWFLSLRLKTCLWAELQPCCLSLLGAALLPSVIIHGKCLVWGALPSYRNLIDQNYLTTAITSSSPKHAEYMRWNVCDVICMGLSPVKDAIKQNLALLQFPRSSRSSHFHRWYHLSPEWETCAGNCFCLFLNTSIGNSN